MNAQGDIIKDAQQHIQQKEIEGLRHTIQSMFSRISKIHEKEFEVLPKAWFMLHDAYGSAYNAVAQLKFSPNFKGMPEAKFEEFLKGCRLTPYQQDELRRSSDRQTYYREAVQGIEFDEAQEKRRVFNNYLIENRIFMTDDLRTKFGDVSKTLVEALTSYDVGKQAEDHTMQREGIRSITNLQPAIDEVEKAVQERLKFGDA
jgi:hypothetical protein